MLWTIDQVLNIAQSNYLDYEVYLANSYMIYDLRCSLTYDGC